MSLNFNALGGMLGNVWQLQLLQRCAVPSCAGMPDCRLPPHTAHCNAWVHAVCMIWLRSLRQWDACLYVCCGRPCGHVLLSAALQRAPLSTSTRAGNEASALDDGKERMSKRVDGGVKTLLRQISPLAVDRHGHGGAVASAHPPEARMNTTKFSGRPGDLHMETPFAARAADASPAALKDPPSARGSRSGAGSCSSREGKSRPGHTTGLSLADRDAVATRSATETFMPNDLEAGDSALAGAQAAGTGAAAADVHV